MGNGLPPKLDYYLGIISVHIIDALDSDGVKKSCIASLLLAFAAIDGCGRLIHEKDNPTNNERLTAFLALMGDRYIQQAEQLCDLRHSLVHSALNVGTAMSSMPDAERLHLFQPDGVPHILVSTSVFVRDLKAAITLLRKTLMADDRLRARAEDRLEFAEVFDSRSCWGGACVTTVPPLRFRYVRTRNANSNQ